MKTQMDSSKRIVNNIVLKDEPLRSESTQQATGEELKTFQSKARICDAVRIKPSGHLTADVAEHAMKVNSCKDTLRIGTWNVRSMNQGKLEVVKSEIEWIKLDLLGISELKWTGMGYFESNEYIIYYAGNEKHKRNGVAFIIKKKLERTIMKYNAVSERLISIRLRGTPVNITIIQVYAPTTDAEQEEVDEFYDQVQAEIDRTCKQDVLIVMGDWNAKVGNKEEAPVVGKYGLGNRNEAGERLLEFCKTNNLFISNTFFQQHKRRLYTWTSPNGIYKNQIDYICENQRWKSSITSTKTKPGADCGTDHQLLLCKFKLKLKKRKPIMKAPKYDLENIPLEFRNELRNRFAALDTGNRVPEELWEDIKKTVHEVCERSLQKVKRQKRSKWISTETLEIARKRREARAKGERETVMELNRKFQCAARQDKKKYYNDVCKEMESDITKGKTRSAFLKLRELKKKFKFQIGMLKDAQGFMLTDTEKIKERWKEYTELLYRKDQLDQQLFQPIPYDQEPLVLKEEVQAALKALSKNKAPGIDGIPVEILRQTDVTVDVLTSLCQQIWKTTLWPTDWKRSVFIPLWKKGDPTDCGNYRIIALISHTSKILLKIIQWRLQPYLERELPEVQAGFRRGRGTRDVIANVRWILEKAKEYQKDIYMCFIDYSKAFDCVDHEKLWVTLRRMGIPEHLVVLIRNLYSGQEAIVRTEQGETQWFRIGKGVRQGCILSPYLFNLYAEQIIRKAGLYEEQRGVKIGGRLTNNLRYADDTTLLAENEADLKYLLMKLKEQSISMGLHLNLKKTKILTTGNINNFMLDGEDIEIVANFSLLWSMINTQATSSQEIQRRIALGKMAMNDLDKIISSRDVSLHTKIRLVQTLVFSITSYGCESWTVKKQDRKKVDAFELWCWRRTLRIPWTARRTNKSVLEEIKPKSSLEAQMMKLRLSYFGHIMLRERSLEKDIMLGKVEGQRKRGRPATRWIDTITTSMDSTLSKLKQLAEDRQLFRTTIHRVAMSRYRLDGT